MCERARAVVHFRCLLADNLTRYNEGGDSRHTTTPCICILNENQIAGLFLVLHELEKRYYLYVLEHSTHNDDFLMGKQFSCDDRSRNHARRVLSSNILLMVRDWILHFYINTTTITTLSLHCFSLVMKSCQKSKYLEFIQRSYIYDGRRTRE